MTIPNVNRTISAFKSFSGNATSCSSNSTLSVKKQTRVAIQACVNDLLAAALIVASIAKLYILQLFGSARSPYAAGGRKGKERL